MKKIFATILILIACCLTSLGGGVFYARAIQSAINYYLIEADYSQNASNYGILSEEIKSTSTPFDYSTNKMMQGQSIMPVVTNQTTQAFSKTLTINATQINNNQSLYMYLYFSEELANNLKITLSDGGENSILWEISSQTLTNQTMHDTSNSRLRYGWQLVELPISMAQKSGTIITATQMIIEYYSNTQNSQNKYARLTFYAPYISDLKNSGITFSNKQNYYNFSVNFGENFNNLCVGDYLTVESWKDLFDYCIIGDVDCLKYDINQYQFKLELFNGDESMLECVLFNASAFSVGFTEAGSYTFRTTLYDSDNNWLWKAPDQQTNIREFIAVYLPNGLPNMSANKSANFKIYVGDLATETANLTATSSDTSVATVSIEGDELVVNTHGKGKAIISLSIDAKRANAEEQTYTYDYTITVTQDSTTSWIGIILGSIGLIIVSVLVYIIMVKRRLIAGRYPKY